MFAEKRHQDEDDQAHAGDDQLLDRPGDIDPGDNDIAHTEQHADILHQQHMAPAPGRPVEQHEHEQHEPFRHTQEQVGRVGRPVARYRHHQSQVGAEDKDSPGQHLDGSCKAHGGIGLFKYGNESHDGIQHHGSRVYKTR